MFSARIKTQTCDKIVTHHCANRLLSFKQAVEDLNTAIKEAKNRKGAR